SNLARCHTERRVAGRLRALAPKRRPSLFLESLWEFPAPPESRRRSAAAARSMPPPRSHQPPTTAPTIPPGTFLGYPDILIDNSTENAIEIVGRFFECVKRDELRLGSSTKFMRIWNVRQTKRILYNGLTWKLLPAMFETSRPASGMCLKMS